MRGEHRAPETERKEGCGGPGEGHSAALSEPGRKPSEEMRAKGKPWKSEGRTPPRALEMQFRDMKRKEVR